jgi:hypothetical protein
MVIVIKINNMCCICLAAAIVQFYAKLPVSLATNAKNLPTANGVHGLTLTRPWPSHGRPRSLATIAKLIFSTPADKKGGNKSSFIATLASWGSLYTLPQTLKYLLLGFPFLCLESTRRNRLVLLEHGPIPRQKSSPSHQEKTFWPWRSKFVAGNEK